MSKLSSETALALLAPVLQETQAGQYSESSLAAARKTYGSELTSDIMRWHQANQLVTSGANPGGGVAGFNDSHRQWAARVEMESQGLKVADELSMLLQYEEMVSQFLGK
jgi:hypothetical protein